MNRGGLLVKRSDEHCSASICINFCTPSNARRSKLGGNASPHTDNHPAFNLALRVNFVCGGPETGRFHFTGSEGVMTIGDGVSLSKPPQETEPGESAGGFSKETAAKIMAQHRERYPEHLVTAATMPEADEEGYIAPRG